MSNRELVFHFESDNDAALFQNVFEKMYPKYDLFIEYALGEGLVFEEESKIMEFLEMSKNILVSYLGDCIMFSNESMINLYTTIVFACEITFDKKAVEMEEIYLKTKFFKKLKNHVLVQTGYEILLKPEGKNVFVQTKGVVSRSDFRKISRAIRKFFDFNPSQFTTEKTYFTYLGFQK